MKEIDALQKMCPELSVASVATNSHEAGLEIVDCIGSDCAIWEDWHIAWEKEIAVDGDFYGVDKNSFVYAYYNTEGNLVGCFENNKGHGQCGYITKQCEC